jgi:hypothetical protein
MWFRKPNTSFKIAKDSSLLFVEPRPLHSHKDMQGCIQKFLDWFDNEINNNNKQ